MQVYRNKVVKTIVGTSSILKSTLHAKRESDVNAPVSRGFSVAHLS